MPLDHLRASSFSSALLLSILFVGVSPGGSASFAAAGEPNPRHWIAAGSESIALDAPSAGVSARVTPDGLACTARPITLTCAPRDVTLTLRTTSFGRAGAEHVIDRGALTSTGERVELARGEFTEWFAPHALGVEQGWTIASRPGGEGPLLLGVTLDGLWPRITDDGLAADLVDERGVVQLHYRGLIARDAMGRALPARLVPASHGIGVRVDDAGAVYPVEIDPVVSGPVWTFEGLQAGAWFGEGAATAGDVDGNGYSDLVVGSRYYNNGQTDEGAMFVFLGSASGLSNTPQIVELNVAGAFFGYRVNSAGDVNGDGFHDVIASAFFYSNGNTHEGAAFLFLGSASGLSSVPIWSVEGQQDDAQLGNGNVTSAGDVNGDGYDDVLVCAFLLDHPEVDEGVVYIYYGNASANLNATPPSVLERNQPTFRFGSGGSGVGDVNADGYDDLVVGSATYSNGESNEGAVFLYLGTASGISTTAAWSKESDQPGAILSEVAPAGDLNGDGFADFVVGLSSANGAQGAARVYYGSNPLPLGVPTVLNGAGSGVEYGARLAAAGDVDGDGFGDLLVTALFDNSPNPANGRVYLYLGGPNGLLTPAAVELTGDSQANSAFGWGLGTAGDVNGDGLSDIVIGQPLHDLPGPADTNEGRVVVYRGQRDGPVLVAPLAGQTATLSGTPTSSYATSLTTAGDVNGDGFSDLLVGAPDFDGTQTDEGRALLYRGSATGLESTPIWDFTSGVANARLGATVAFAGDVNNDGYGDVLIGAPRLSLPQFQEGRAYLFLGNASGLLGSTPSWTFETNEPNAKVGEALAGAGDVDGDGFTDVFLGAPGAAVATVQDAGRVYVFRGSATGLSGTPSLVLDDPVVGDWRFGAALANAGDVNRDGRTDLLVGSPDYTDGQTHEGRVYLYLGAGANLATTAAFTFESDTANAVLGTAVSAAGDVDSDGYADLLVGAPEYPGGGRVWLYRGQSGVNPIAGLPQVFDSAQAGARYGATLARAGDVDNDGFSDFLIGAPNFNTDQGNVQLYLGTAVAPALEFPGAAGANLGGGLGPCGDVDGDGFSDVVLGQPGQLSGAGGAVIYMGSTQYGATRRTQQRTSSSANAMHLLALETEQTGSVRLQGGPNSFANVRGTAAGRERVALEWEIKGGAALLDGTNLVRGAFQDLGAQGSPPPATPLALTELVTGLTPSQRYQWRTRIVTTNPLFPHTPWTQVQGNGQDEKKFGTGFDCNNNGIPDSTEVAANPSIDCNGNGAPDSCDIAGGVDPDCDNDGVPNSCELFANDCDANLFPDDCQITAGGASVDCNANNVLDTCELSPATDANGDSILDACQFVPFCFGDGTGTACPCGNSGGAGRGCANSVNAQGAVLTLTGEPSITNDTLVLHGAGMPNSVSPSAIYLQGTLQDNSGLGTPIQDGLRCVTGALIRLGTRPNSGNQSQYPDVGNVVISIRGQLNTLTPPVTRYYQVFYRNAATAFCPPGTANWTNGLAVTWHL